MTAEALFALCNAAVLPGWALLLFAPRWKWTERAIGSCALPLLLALGYLCLILAFFRGAEGGFGSLAQVALLFRNPYLLLAGWIHYLAFDLFIGGWEVRDARRLGLPHWLVAPCLLATFLLGPIGLLAYFVLRAALRGRVMVSE